MLLSDKQRSWMYIHISVFLWGFTAILGRLIELRELPLVFYRILITVAGMFLLPNILKELKQLKKNEVIQLTAIGSLIMVHWLTFYGSIKVSNASVAVSCLSTTGIITSLCEPFLLKKRFQWKELFFGCLVIPGMWLILHFEPKYQLGITLGLISAVFSALFGISNKKMVEKHPPNVITMVELGMGNLMLLLAFPFYYYFFPDIKLLPSINDWGWLFILASLCTILPFILSLKALKHLSAFSTALTINLEPIYAFILAGLFFKEYEMFQSKIMITFLNLEVKSFYLGATLILFAVIIYSIGTLKKKNEY